MGVNGALRRVLTRSVLACGRQGHRPHQQSRQGICTRLPQRPDPLHGSDAMRWAVTARRSDGPAHGANNMGESQILLRVAYMMMPALH